MKIRPMMIATCMGVLSLMMLYNNCSKKSFSPASGSSSQSSSGPAPTPAAPAPTPVAAIPLSTALTVKGTEPNVVAISQGTGYVNEPTVTVTICKSGGVVGSANCVAIPNVLVDTGSFGLRVFGSLVPFANALPPQLDTASGTPSHNPIGECQAYLDGSSDWGGVVIADVVLGGERAPAVSLQMIDPNFGLIPDDCNFPETDPASAGYNGILGVGLLQADCGDYCASDLNNRMYFQCTTTLCRPIGVPPAQQTVNPVFQLPTDNNGVIIQLASIAPAGATAMMGYMILGIGTGNQTDNTPPTGVTVFPTDDYLNIQTVYGGQTITQAFLDSGSNMYYFNDPNLNLCSDGSGLYCPATAPANLTAVVQGGGTGLPQDTVAFQVADGITLENSTNTVFGNAGAVFSFSSTQQGFDWGLPFFFGKTVYVGYAGATTPIGSGPYWGF